MILDKPEKAENREKCRLCGSESPVFYREKKMVFHKCPECKGIFLSGDYLPDREKERNRYLKHRNDPKEGGYRKFLEPLTSRVTKEYLPASEGLDFGAGPGGAVSEILKEKGYLLKLYDPFFFDFPSLLENQYDFIICCETSEHFHHPSWEFMLLRKMLRPGGRLFCMTELYDPVSIDFKRWHYKNDFTHVFLYQKETFFWIREKFFFSRVEIDNRIIILSG